jgi:pimeloyl-ACP methyl ester carboxylesterase
MIPPLLHRVFNGPSALHFVEGPVCGPSLLLLHGVSRNWRDWEPLLPELMREWHVIALDHRGHGESARAPDGYFVVDYARDAAAFVRATFKDPVTVMGHSLGAMVALSLAVECSELVAGVVLEDPPFHTMGRGIAETPYCAQFAGMKEVARQGGELDAMTEALAAIQLPTAQGYVRLGDVRDRASLQFSAECLAQVDPEVFTPLIAGHWLEGFNYESLWSCVTCPALLLQGDPAAGGAFADAALALAQRLLPNQRHIRFTGVGHQIHRTRPEEFLAALREFAQTDLRSNATQRKAGARSARL